MVIVALDQLESKIASLVNIYKSHFTIFAPVVLFMVVFIVSLDAISVAPLLLILLDVNVVVAVNPDGFVLDDDKFLMLLVVTSPLLFEPPKTLVIAPFPRFMFVVVTPASFPPPKTLVAPPDLKFIVEVVVSAFSPPPYMLSATPPSTVISVVLDVPPKLFPPKTLVAVPFTFTSVVSTVPF